jgi:hypothetical protein
MPAHTKPFTLEGHTITPVARECVLRDDKMVGRCSAFHKPTSLADIYWYTPQQIAARAGVPLATIVARLKARWNFADLIKPEGHERIVDARRNGVLLPNGERLTLKQLAARTGAVVQTIERRIRDQWTVEELLMPGQLRRVELGDAPPPAGVPTTPMTTPPAARKGLAVGPRATFYFRGALDSLQGHCRTHGVTYATVASRLRRGVRLEDAFTLHRMPRSDKGKPNPARGNRNPTVVPRADGTPDPSYPPGLRPW